MAGEAAFEVTILVVMNGIGRFLVPDVETGDKVDDEAEDVELHHTSYVSPFAREIESTNLQINILEAVTCCPWFCYRKILQLSPASTEDLAVIRL